MTPLEVKHSISTDRSKQNIHRIAVYFSENPEKLSDSITLVEGSYKLSMRYSWMLSHVAELTPQAILPHLSYLFQVRNQMNYNGYLRHLTRIFAFTGIPEDIEGEVVDQLFCYCLDPNKEVAVKVHAIASLYRIVKQYPELKQEFIDILEDQKDKNTVAFRSRANKLLKKLT